MKKTQIILLYLLMFPAFLTGCSWFQTGQKLSLDLPLQKVNRIVVTDNRNKKLFEENDPKIIQRITEFVGMRKEGWYAPWYGIPTGRWLVNFYSDKEFLGHFGIGSNFFEAQIGDGFYIRDAKSTEVSALMKMVFEKEGAD